MTTPDGAQVEAVAAILRRVPDGHPRAYAGDWYADTARRILKSLNDAGFTVAEADKPTIHELIERSSLGTPEAKAIRAQTPPHVVDEIMRRVDEREYIPTLGEYAEIIEFVVMHPGEPIPDEMSKAYADACERAALRRFGRQIAQAMNPERND